MKINLNMSAVLTNKQLRRTENKLQQSMGRLSSGYKINSPGDNPAGLAISSKMQAQIDGLKQANSNASDGVSVLQIADGALNEVSSILQRVRELAVQAANDTNNYEDRKAIQDEIAQLKQEVNRISSDTEYNTKKLLDGSSDTRIYTKSKVGGVERLYTDDIQRINISDTVTTGIYNVTIEATATRAASAINIPPESDGKIGIDGEISINGVSMKVTSEMSQEEYLQKLHEAAEEAGVEVIKNGEYVTLHSVEWGSKSNIEVKLSASLAGDLDASGKTLIGKDDSDLKDTKGDKVEVKYELDETGEYYVSKNSGEDCIVKLNIKSDEYPESLYTKNATWTSDGNRVYVQDNDGFAMDFMINKDIKVTTADPEIDVEMNVTDMGDMSIHIGSNQYQNMDVRIPEVSTESLYLDDLDVTYVGGASHAISAADEAIAKLSSVRSRIGAYQNRLEHAIASLGETEEDMTAAYSRLMDTDMAQEMTEYSNQNILDQATISVLSQANDLPQQVLSLLQ